VATTTEEDADDRKHDKKLDQSKTADAFSPSTKIP